MGQNPEERNDLSEVGMPTIEFTKVDDYTTFRAEYGFDGNDIVFHFYLPPELVEAAKKGGQVVSRIEKYWEENFPRSLDVVARNYFKAEYPRLKAARVKEYEIDSWWLRANGYADNIAVKDLVTKFFETFDQALDAVKVNHLGV